MIVSIEELFFNYIKFNIISKIIILFFCTFQVFFQGTGKQCRIQVQHLNALKANEETDSNSDSYANNNCHAAASQFSFSCNNSAANSMKRTRAETQSDFDDFDFDFPNTTSDNQTHLQKKFKFDSSAQHLSHSTETFSIATEDEMKNLIQSRFQAENTEENVCDMQNENVDQKSGLCESESIFSNLLEDEEEDSDFDSDLKTDVEAEPGVSTFDKVKEDEPKEHFFDGGKDSIFSNLLSDSESDTDETVILSGGNKKVPSTESCFEGDNKIPMRQIESEYSIFESNDDIDWSIDF